MPNPAGPPVRIARFGSFELDLVLGELKRRGRVVALQDQQAVVLKYLVEHAGVMVTREELRGLLWPEGTHVEFEFGMYNTVNRLRRALGDSASNPHFIETEPKQGYRFIAAVKYPAPEGGRLDSPTEPQTESFAGAWQESAQPEPVNLLNSRSQVLGAAVIFTFLGAVLGVGWARWGQRSANAPVYRFGIPVGGAKTPSIAISPGGDQLVFQGEHALLYRRYLDTSDARAIRGTEGGRSPFFSPNGESLGFFTDRELKVVEAERVRALAVMPAGYGFWDGVWANDGFIYFNTRIDDTEGIWRIPAGGGQPRLVVASSVKDQGAERVFVNQVVTSPRHLLLYSVNAGPARRSLRVRDLDKQMDKTILEPGMGAHLLSGGLMIYYSRGSLYEIPFDARRLNCAGSPIEVVKDVAPYFWQSGAVSLSDSGTLAYVPSPAPELKQLEWLDERGRYTPLPVQADQYEQAEVSPKGDQLAIVRTEDVERSSLWTYGLQSGAWRRILDSRVPVLRAQWSPDGTELVVSSEKQNGDLCNLYRVPLADPGKAQRLTEEPDYGQFPNSWSAKANAILFLEGRHRDTNSDIMVLPMSGNARPKRLVASSGWDRGASFSPDGSRFAYDSDAGGRAEVFVAPYDSSKAEAAGPAVQVSQNGGHDAAWSRDGHSLYFINGTRQLIRATLTERGAVAGSRTIVESMPYLQNRWTRAFSMAPDDRMLVVNTLSSVPKESEIRVVVNWGSELSHSSAAPWR